MSAAVNRGQDIDHSQENVDAIDENRPPSEETALQHGAITDPPFNHSKEDQQQTEGYEGANDRARAPRLRHAAPLKGKHVANNGRHDGDCAEWIHLEQFLSPACFDWFRRGWRLEEEENDEGGGSAYGEIDVKTVTVSVSWTPIPQHDGRTTTATRLST